MAVDVIIDPSSGQIYWNDNAGVGTQTIAISGNASNAINVVGYSNFFSPGGGGLGTQILATFNDSATATFVPGTSAYDLGSSSLRWNFYGTGGNFTGVISTSSSTASTSTSTGALVVTGGIGIGSTSYFGQDVVIQGSTAGTTPSIGALTVTGGVGIGGTLNVGIATTAFTPTGVMASFARNVSSASVVIQNTSASLFSTVKLSLRDNLGLEAYLRFYNSNGSGLTDNRLELVSPATIFYTSGAGSSDIHYFSGGRSVQIAQTTTSTSTSTGALIVNGGAGIAKTSYFGQSVVIQGSTASGSTTTGALTVTGGVGIGGSLQVFGIIDVADNIEVLSQKEVRFFNSANSFYTGLRAGSSSASVTFTLPIADGSANQVLYTNGSAALGWTTPSGSAAGSSTWVQYNQGGAFGATSAFTFVPSTGILSAPNLTLTNSQANEGGEIVLSQPSSGTALTTTITVDIYQNRIRFFETGGANRGAYIDFTACGNGVATNLLVGSGASGISSLNGLTATTQTFATGTSGSDFNISSATSTHTFNIPYAGAASTGLITTQTQTIAGAKTFSGQTSITSSVASTSTTTGALIISGGVGIAGSIWSGQHINIDTTVSSSTSTGAMLIFGGLGVSGQINAASLQTAGNAIISGNLQFNGNGTWGNATTDTITSLARYASDLLPSADNTYDLGNNSLGWRNFRVSGVGTIASLAVTSVVSGLWAGTAITLAYGGTNNTISGVGHSYRVAIYDAAGTAITNVSSAGTANSIFFQASQSASPNWVGQSQLVVGGASTAANIQGGALGNIHYQSAANTTAFVTNAAGSGASLLSQTGNSVPIFIGQSQITAGGASTAAAIQGGSLGNILYQSAANTTTFVNNAAGSGASVLTQTGNAAPSFLGQSQLLVGSASTSAQIVTDASTATRYIVGTILNTASSGGTVLSTGSGITIGNNLLTTGSLAVTNTTGSATTTTGALTVVGGVGIGGTLNVGTFNLTYSAPNLIAGFASSVNSYNQLVLQNASTGATASADFVINNNLSTDGTYYGNFGMNSSNFTGAGSLSLPNAVYLTSTTGDLVLGSTTANILRFVYNAGASDSMQITGTAVSVMYSTGSTSTSTGALTVLGGVGIGGSLWTATTNFASISGVGHSNSVITSGVWSGTAISAVNGGTGQVSYAIGDILYASSTTALTKLSAGTAGSVLASGGVGAAPYWKADATGGGGGSPAGSTSQLQYNNGGSFGATSGLTFNLNGNNEFIVNTPYLVGTQGVINIGPRPFDGVSLGQFAGSSNGTQIAINAATGFVGNFEDYQINGSSKFTVGFDGKITVVGVYSLPTTAGTAGSVLTSNGTGNQLYWAASGGGGGSGTVSSGTAGSVAYYPTSSTTVGGAPGFTYTTAGTASTVNIFGGGTAGTYLFTVQAYSATSVRVGIGTNLPQYELEINGEISATNKSFVITHPTKPGKKLRYGSLEGPENGVYVRGELINSNIIETPDHWIGLVHPDSFTVTLTPIGRYAQLYVDKIEDYKVYVADNCLNPIHCYYTVWAERKDIPKLITEY